MSDLFEKKTEIHIPRRYDLNGRVHRNRVEKIARVESVENLDVSLFSHRTISALAGDLDEGQPTLFLPRKSTAQLDGFDLLVVPDCSSQEELSKKSREGSISWLRPRPQSPTQLSLEEAQIVVQRIRASWTGNFTFQVESRDDTGVVQPGLRPPQIGAMHAALAHWSVSTKPATIVMPTGTGKTETMLALLTGVDIERLMVVVPNAALRDQIAEKFLTLGILKSAGVLARKAELPGLLPVWLTPA